MLPDRRGPPPPSTVAPEVETAHLESARLGAGILRLGGVGKDSEQERHEKRAHATAKHSAALAV
jgi:hypothetical protein